MYEKVSSKLGVKERQYGNYLQDLEKKGKIKTPEFGYYASVNYVNVKNNEDEERE